MEKNKGSNKIKDIVIIILAILVACLFFVTIKDKTLTSSSTNVSNSKNEDNLNYNEEENIDKNENKIENIESPTINEDNNTSSIECNDFKVDYSKLHDMGSGIGISSATGYNYVLSIKSDGKLTYQQKTTGNSATFDISNVSNVIFHQYAGEENGEYFILKDDGSLYTITEKVLLSGSSELIKDEVLGKVIYIGSYTTGKSNAGGGWGVYAITSDGVTHELAFDSV